jgi:hypothetical protein
MRAGQRALCAVQEVTQSRALTPASSAPASPIGQLQTFWPVTAGSPHEATRAHYVHDC